jgi:hypothetical protein
LHVETTMERNNLFALHCKDTAPVAAAPSHVGPCCADAQHAAG